MFSAMHYITFAEGADQQAAIEAIRKAAEATAPVSLVAVPHEITGVNAGNLVCKLGFEDRAEYDAAKKDEGWASLQAVLDDRAVVENVDFGAYDAGIAGIGSPDATDCVHRVLMFAEQDRAKPEDVEALTQLCTQFHVYVPGMLNWRVADIVESSGKKEWKHIWEQDFDSVDTFTGTYMFTPFHPAYLDTYFDTECPNYVADPELCTMTCDEEVAFLGNFA